MADTPPLLLKDYWPYQAAVLGDLVGRHTAQIARRKADLNLSQWRVLAAVGEAPGRTAREVVDVTPMDKGIVSRAVSTLIERGLMARTAKTKDRRQAALTLTADGERSYRLVAAELKIAIEPITRSLGGASDFTAALKAAVAAYPKVKP